VGYAGVGVADVMKEAGLTHGGFYAHFDSRDALLVEALDRAGRESRRGGDARGRAAGGKGCERLPAL
jgi:AcrR family transcriptional regulator